MNMKRILSAALMVVMTFTAVAFALPLTASAAYSPSSAVSTAELNEAELTNYLNETINYDEFSSAAQMLSYEYSLGYLYSVNSANSLYTLYINKFNGFVYYVNNVTGQILTSNPINVGYKNSMGSPAIEELSRQEIMSQINIKFFESGNSQKKYEYNSFRWAALRSQILITPINGGLRVNYTLGDTMARFLLPGRIKAVDFENDIIIPMLDKYLDLLKSYLGDEYTDEELSYFENDKYDHYFDYGSETYGGINTAAGSKNGLRTYLNDMDRLAMRALGNTAQYRALYNLNASINTFLGSYTLYAPSRFIQSIAEKGEENAANDVKMLEKIYKDYPVTMPLTDEEGDYGTAIYVYSASSLNEFKKGVSDIIKENASSYTFAMMYEDEKECGYVDNSAQKPVFRCALEYTFNKDGSLSVRLPANSITFDETVYTLESITPLRYFGCGDMQNDGYIFYPDGSGTIVEFEDFYNESNNKKIAISLESNIYGKDFCYSMIEGAHRAQITMPVYGLVNEVAASPLSALITGKDTVTNGYFAIVEEGESLANLGLMSGGSTHVYANAYASYNPYPSDKYDLSESITVGGLGEHIIVSDSKYSGSYITRYVMLTDEAIGEVKYGKDAYYATSYVGMAAYYKNYLKDIGVLTALELVSEDLPLYIETLGAMDILDKFLTFPITKTIPLTTFENVLTMYNELAECSTYIELKAKEYRELAANEKDPGQKYQYEKKAETYEALIGKVEDIKNINFRLTGFANGGMNFTYPVRAKWEKVCGRKSGFYDLRDAANEASDAEGVNFGIFPEFDFMYIYNTKAGDGIKIKGNVSRMVDNRYASKQVYNAVKQEYESFFTLVIAPDALSRLFGKFESRYAKHGIKTISASTLGSDLNSNFDDDNPINRDDAQKYVCEILDRMVATNEYEVMLDTGNIYSVKYATHILNASLDSSHFRYSSFAIPFTGLILHGYVNYTGAPINYSGSIDYDLLKAIENGASLYYLLCYQNTEYMKEDENLNKYYGVDYENWYDSILEVYTELNAQIGSLQNYDIVDHKTLFVERVIEDGEMLANYALLEDEILTLLDQHLAKAVDDAFDELYAASDYEKRVKVSITDSDFESLINQFAQILNKTADEIKSSDFMGRINALIEKYESEYVGDDANSNSYNVSIGSIVYTSDYSYITDSLATDKDYVYTDYTVDDGTVVMVTYQNGDSVVRFILNYNIFSVTVKLDADREYTIGKHGYIKIVE